MTPEMKAALVQSQSACALIEAAGMQAENQQRLLSGQSVAYAEEAFNKLIDKYGIGQNTVIDQFLHQL